MWVVVEVVDMLPGNELMKEVLADKYKSPEVLKSVFVFLYMQCSYLKASTFAEKVSDRLKESEGQMLFIYTL